MAEAAQHRHRSCREQQGLQVKLLPLSSRAGGRDGITDLNHKLTAGFAFREEQGGSRCLQAGEAWE